MPPGASPSPNPISSGGGKPKPTEKVGDKAYQKESSLTDDPNRQGSGEDQNKPQEAEKDTPSKGGKAASKGKDMVASASETAKDVKDVAKAGPTGLENSAQEIKQGADKNGARGAAGAAGRQAAGQAVAGGLDVVTAGATAEAHGKIATGVSKGLKKENLPKVGLIIAIPVILPLIIVGIIIGSLIYAAQNPAKFLEQVLTDPKARDFAAQAARIAPQTIANQGNLLKQYGYVEKRPGATAIAQANSSAPKPGSLAEKLTKINIKNAVYQTNSKPSCPYTFTTKDMVGPNGQQTSVIDKVYNDKGQEVSDDNFVVQFCIIQSMPLFNLMVRVDNSREVNTFGDVVLNYAAEKDALKGKSRETVSDYVYGKTYNRITSKEDDAPTINNENVDDYIVRVRKALKDGDNPYSVDSDFQFKPGFDTEDKKTVSTMCTFAQGYLSPENLRSGIYARLNTGQRSGVKWNTISSTRELNEMSNEELSATLKEVDNWAASRAYSQNVYGRQTGEAVNPESLSNTSYGAGYQYAIAVLTDTTENCSKLDSGGIFGRIFGNGNVAELNQIKANYNALRGIIIAQSNGKFTGPNDFGLQQLMIGMIRMGGGSAVSGLEPGPQNFNNQSQGFRGLSNQYMMRIGGKFLTKAESNRLDSLTENTRREIEQKNGLAYRLFDTNNIRSLANIMRFESPRTPNEINRKGKEYIAMLGNPIKIIADIQSSFGYYATGKTNQAFAADAMGDAYMRIDTIGLPEEMFNGVNLLTNSDEIQNMTANGTPEQKKVLSYFDKCSKSNYPSKAFFVRRSPLDTQTPAPDTGEPDYGFQEVDGWGYPYYPAMADKIEYPRGGDQNISNFDKQPVKEEKKEFMACEIYLGAVPTSSGDSGSTIPLNQRKDLFGFEDVEGLAKKYHLYLYSNSMADLMVELSNTDESRNIYANPSGDNNSSPTGPNTPVDPGTDTSNTPCPTTAGITDDGIKQDYGPGGVETVKIRVCIVDGIDVNVSIAAKVKEMLDAAKVDGINFGGGGFRSYEEQVALRKAHCPDWQNSPANACSPPTAKPGTSMHEVGLAIDFTLNGRTLTRGDPGFNWLSQNASKYGFTNLPSEAWHWSVNGN